jgi:hypothetical protein
MRRLLYIFCLLVLWGCPGFAQWQVLELPTYLNLKDVFYRGTEQILISCSEGFIYKSDDSGITWDCIQLTESSDLNSIMFINENTGFITGNNGKIFKTEDGGNNWSENSMLPYFHINDMSFFDNGKVIAAGTKEVHIEGNTYFLPAILITTNLGDTWTESQFDFWGNLKSVTYLANGDIIAVGDYGLIVRSDDDGSTWSVTSLDLLQNLNTVMECPDNTTIIAGDNGTFLYSIDHGENWNSITLPSYYNINKVCFNGNILAACSKEVNIDGRTFNMATVLELIPWINEWTEHFSEVRGTYRSINFCRVDKGITVGDSGRVAVYGISSSTNSDKNYSPDAFQLKQNHPNPFNPTTSIQYAVSSMQFVSLKVYDILGNEITTLVDEYKPAGVYNVEFSINNEQLSSGIYFYKLTAGSYTAVKKMVLMK